MHLHSCDLKVHVVESCSLESWFCNKIGLHYHLQKQWKVNILKQVMGFNKFYTHYNMFFTQYLGKVSVNRIWMSGCCVYQTLLKITLDVIFTISMGQDYFCVEFLINQWYSNIVCIQLSEKNYNTWEKNQKIGSQLCSV